MGTSTLYLNSVLLATEFVPKLFLIVIMTTLLVGVALKFLKRL